MSKEFSFPNKGTCSKQTNFVLNDDHTIASIEVVGGCNGNLKAISKLVEGASSDRVIEVLAGNTCGTKKTSCADQLTRAIEAARAEIA